MNTHSVEQLEADIVQLSSDIAAATYELLVRIRAFDESRAWAEQGAVSCAHWLNFRVGLALRTGRDKVRIAHALAELPLISAEFAKGALKYSQVRAITRVADAENEDTLLVYAKHSTASELERIVRGIKRLKEEGKPQREKRSFSMQAQDDGMVVMRTCMLPEEAAVLRKAMQATTKIPAKGEHVDHVQALVEMAERSLGNGSREPRTDDRYQVVLHVEADRAHIDDETVSRSSAERMMCDASVVTMVHDKEGNVLSVGRKTRVVPANIRRAVMARDKHCVFPGCTHAFVDTHHIKEWQHQGETSVKNLALLCRIHHSLVHEGRFSIEGTGGAVRFVDKHGRTVQATPPPPSQALAKACCDDMPGSSSHERIDYGLVVSAFAHRYMT